MSANRELVKRLTYYKTGTDREAVRRLPCMQHQTTAELNLFDAFTLSCIDPNHGVSTVACMIELASVVPEKLSKCYKLTDNMNKS